MRRFVIQRLAGPWLALLVSCAAVPDPSLPTAPPEPAPPAAEPAGAIETTRASLRHATEWLARGIDGWFGDRPFEEGGEVTNGRMVLGMTRRQDEKADYSLRFNAHVRLPNLERQTYLFVGRDKPSDVLTDKPDVLTNQNVLVATTPEERRFFVGLGRNLGYAVDLRLGFRGVKPYAQARYRHGWEIGERGRIEFRETLFWTLRDRLGSTTTLSWDRAYTPTLALRWLSSATITQDSGRFIWSSILGADRSFGERRVWSFEALVNGDQDSGVPATDYGVQTRWAQPVFGGQLLGEVVVGQFWPRANEATARRRAWALGGNLIMEF